MLRIKFKYQHEILFSFLINNKLKKLNYQNLSYVAAILYKPVI